MKDVELIWKGKQEMLDSFTEETNKKLLPLKEKSIDWNNTENIYIEGDNLDALKILQKDYAGKIDVIYIDPPYNTGVNRMYKDKWEHSDWLNMMYPRLKLARNLLSDDGVIFISIDDNEQARLKELCDEIFGEENFVSNLGIEISKTQGPKVSAAKKGTIVKNYEYILIYQKNLSKYPRTPLYDEGEVWDAHYNTYINHNDEKISLLDFLKQNNKIVEEFKRMNFKISHDNIAKVLLKNDFIKEFIYDHADKIYREMPANISLQLNIEDIPINKITRYDKYLLTKTKGGKIRQYQPLSSSLGNIDNYRQSYGRRTIRGNLWKGFYSDMMNIGKEDGIEFKNAKKPIRLIKQLIKWANVKDGYILDFFSGSGTTASAVMQLNAEDGGNRKFIMVQLPEEIKEKENAYKEGYRYITEIGEERIRRAGAKIKEEHPEVDTGFKVFKIEE